MKSRPVLLRARPVVNAAFGSGILPATAAPAERHARLFRAKKDLAVRYDHIVEKETILV